MGENTRNHDTGLNKQAENDDTDAPPLKPCQIPPEDRYRYQPAPYHAGGHQHLVGSGIAGHDEAHVVEDTATDVKESGWK